MFAAWNVPVGGRDRVLQAIAKPNRRFGHQQRADRSTASNLEGEKVQRGYGGPETKKAETAVSTSGR
jgi:predicted DNA-binding WGR domain protein